MIINNNYTTEHVEFINYTGRYPNLCSGVLTLKIDGEICRFGHEPVNYIFSEGRYNDNNYDSFWHSGGSVSFDNDWDCHISTGEWNINIDNLPEKFRKYAAEIDYTFNANVEHGCCGGCS